MTQLLTMLGTILAVMLGSRLSQPKENVFNVSDEPIDDPNTEPFVPEPEKEPEKTEKKEVEEVPSSTEQTKQKNSKWKAAFGRSFKAFWVTVVSALIVNGVAIAGAVVGLFHLPPEIAVGLTGLVAIIGMGLQKASTWKTEEEMEALRLENLGVNLPDTGEKKL